MIISAPASGTLWTDMKILYFARIRQIAGRGSEEIEVPTSVTTVGELIDYLSDKDASLAAAFAQRTTVKAAINQNHVQLDASLEGATEIAFFPPVTGG
jgi:molybdopterin synthase sulfur carrier subunit